MKIVPLAVVKDHFSSYIDESKESPIVVTRNGRPVAMLISINEEEDLDSILLSHNPRFIQLLEDARQHVRATEGVDLTQFREQLNASPVNGTNAYQVETDPLIGLFDGPHDLSEESETILAGDMQEHSGWTWKTSPE